MTPQRARAGRFHGGAVLQAGVLFIPVSPGDQFYLVASSAATAGGTNAFAESLGTLSISFDPADAENLKAANAATPLPALSWHAGIVLVFAIMGLGLCLRPADLRTTVPIAPRYRR